MKKQVLAAVAVATFALGSGQAYASTPPALVVDDDGAQCPDANVTTIQKAVAKAAKRNADPADVNDVELIRVCPGLYIEQVSVPESLTIRGDAEAVEALDCFSTTRPTVDPNTQAIVAAPSGAPASAPAVLFDLQADDIELQGFVLLGQTGSSSRALRTSSGHSGYWVHHNLIMANTVAAIFRSSDGLPSVFDHNCMRDNGWGLANEWLPLVDAQIHDNSSFGTANFAYEQTGNCPEFLETGLSGACLPSRIGMDDVTFEHNVSMADNTTYRFASSKSTTASENTVIRARIGMRLVSSNEDLRIVDNDLEVREVGLARQSNPVPNFGVLIQLNTITGVPGSSAGIGMGASGLKNSQILDNTIAGLQGEGIVLLAGNTANTVRGNTVTNNGSNGVRVAAGATDNTFETNTMLGNGKIAGVDARDDAFGFNVWHGNVCVNDIPMGAICGVP